ncbi:LOW QUALITY PROTEIN: protocadherin-10 [Tachyglossus aculeatus]|uniref:LOW QUALITY PROTEIN: protocadherin-10 n=1 Tax=Tachyglossus aculeatus TaxID=9261 RepID=UPI0018F3637F|nr:LOW QUALITY PROTEIN: protocadherin-10 [Tachyglossus aculeatus]
MVPAWLSVLALACLGAEGVAGQLQYSVKEEEAEGTAVGNIAVDLGLSPAQLSARRFQAVSGSRTPYLSVDLGTGALSVRRRMDREALCRQSPSCLLPLEVFLEAPLELFRVEVEVLDINDHAPAFPRPDLAVEISEGAAPGTRLPLESAADPDAGTNGLQDYRLSPNDFFSLDVQTRADGSRFAELVLDRPLDRESQAVHRYVLTAVDGGGGRGGAGGGGGRGGGGGGHGGPGPPDRPRQTGTALLTVRVLDSNDNAPSFAQPAYTVSLPEDSPPGTLVLQLNATDPDEGPNGEVEYAFASHVSARARALFALGARSGRLELSGALDFEESPAEQLVVQARDRGPGAVPAHCQVLVRVLDANDHAPELAFSTLAEAVSEAAAPGTVVALFSAADRDAGANGRVRCQLLGGAPFRLQPAARGDYYAVVTAGPLDREALAERARGGDFDAAGHVDGPELDAAGHVDGPELDAAGHVAGPEHRDDDDPEEEEAYTLTVVARDGGSPPLSSSRSFRVRVSDENDNAPRFSQPAYDVFVAENNVPGAYISAVTATDRDRGANARLAYAVLDGQIQGMSVATYVSVNAENGFLYALRSFDYERLRRFSFQVEARDAGRPRPLAANATVRVVVLDQNDNAPALLAPPPGPAGGPARRALPRRAPPGSLVARLAAADADDGDNGRLSFALARGNELGLFRLDWRSGELRTARPLPAPPEPRRPFELLLEVRDHGQPPLSATATLLVRLVDGDGDPDGDPPDGDPPPGGGGGGGGGAGGARPSGGPGEPALDLTLILIVALGSLSFIFLLAMIVLAVRCRKDRKLDLYTCLARGGGGGAEGAADSACCCPCCCCPPCRRRRRGSGPGAPAGSAGGAGGPSCCSRQARARKKKLSKADIMLVPSANAPGAPDPPDAAGPGGFGGPHHPHHHHQPPPPPGHNYCYQVCLTPESANTDLVFLKPRSPACSPARGPGPGPDGDPNPGPGPGPCAGLGAGYPDQQPDIIANGGVLSTEAKHQRTELSYLVDRPRRGNSSAFQEADMVSSKDSGHGDSEQGDSDHDAANRGQLAGTDLFSNCTDECKALGHSDRCWMPSFVPPDGRQPTDYRSNLHVPGMDAMPGLEAGPDAHLLLEPPEAQPGPAERSFSTFGKDKALPGTLDRKELDGLLTNTRAPYKPPYLNGSQLLPDLVHWPWTQT